MFFRARLHFWNATQDGPLKIHFHQSSDQPCQTRIRSDWKVEGDDLALFNQFCKWCQRRAKSTIRIGDRVKTLYKQFCRKAARLGAHREPSEGPSDFANRAAQLLPNESDRIRRISNAYITVRYSAAATPVVVEELAKEVELFAKSRDATAPSET